MEKPASSSDFFSAAQFFEIRLCTGFGKEMLVFATVQPDEKSAADFGRAVLNRHPNFDVAEIWQGMKLLRQI
jgi:hypothetical protein